jgi:hypothetical protein
LASVFGDARARFAGCAVSARRAEPGAASLLKKLEMKERFLQAAFKHGDDVTRLQQ